jgi:hypothetical protein
MHPTIGYRLDQARTAEIRHQAQCDSLARAARRAARARRHPGAPERPRLHVLAPRRMLTILRARNT